MKVLVVDASEYSKSFVGKTWIAGAIIFGHKFDHVIFANSWHDVLHFLDNESNIVEEIQVWSHGAQGSPLIGGESFPLNHPLVFNVKRWWFRCCYALAGARGHELAHTLASRGVEVAGHTSVIGYKGLHPNLYALRAWDEPYWMLDPPSDASKPKLFSKRTISALRMTLPKWAFRDGKYFY